MSRPEAVDRGAVALVLAITAAALAVAGWVGPDIDVWYGAGLARALAERPLTAESLGHVPKLGHVMLLAPAAIGSRPEIWLSTVGASALVVLLVAHARWARRVGLPVALVLVALAVVPLVWRGTLDGGSVAWGWSAVVLALVARTKGKSGQAAGWLAAGALFRPEVVGVGFALGALAIRQSATRAWRLVVAPLGASLAGTLIVDLLWTGRLGASSIAHVIFESAAIERIRGRWGFLDSAHPWWHLSLPLVVGAALVLAALLFERLPRPGQKRTTVADPNAPSTSAQANSPERWAVASGIGLGDLLAAAAGFSLVTLANVATGGTLFVRFALPWASVVAALVALAPWPPRGARRLLAHGAIIASGLVAWRVVAREFVGTWPTIDALLVARDVSRRTAGELLVGMDAGARAVSLGSGARPWRTTPWLLESPETPCRAQALIARGALLRQLGDSALARCGPWQDFVVDSSQIPVDVHLLLARRGAR